MSVQAVTHVSFARSNEVLDEFTRDLFAELPRSDQRRWARVHLRGLLAAPGKKSIREIAAAAGRPEAAAALQQFVNSSPWDWRPVRSELAQWVERRMDPQAWTVALAVTPKRGDHSAGVHRRFVPELGRIVNCQAGVGLFLAGERAQVPVDWRMLLPGRWSTDEELMLRARTPAQARELTVSAHVVNLLDTFTERSASLPAPLVVDLSHDRQAGALVRALGERRCTFLVAVPQATTMVPLEQDVVPQPVLTLHGEPLDVRRLLARRGRTVTAVQDLPGGGTRIVRVSTCLVRLPGPARGRGVYRVFAPEPAPGRGVGRIWVTSLVDERPERLLALAGAADRTAATLKTLTDAYGMAAFEGRSFPGWHHHMTLMSAAYAFDRVGGAAHAGRGGQRTAAVAA